MLLTNTLSVYIFQVCVNQPMVWPSMLVLNAGFVGWHCCEISPSWTWQSTL